MIKVVVCVIKDNHRCFLLQDQMINGETADPYGIIILMNCIRFRILKMEKGHCRQKKTFPNSWKDISVIWRRKLHEVGFEMTLIDFIQWIYGMSTDWMTWSDQSCLFSPASVVTGFEHFHYVNSIETADPNNRPIFLNATSFRRFDWRSNE